MRSSCFRRSGVRFLKAVSLSCATLFVLSASTATSQPVVATSTPGIADWEDPNVWSFDPSPSTATIPDNDSLNFFDVRIDGGAASPTDVSLSTAVSIDRLQVSGGDSLSIGDAGTLTIESDSSRAGSGQIVNDGLVLINGATATARLDTTGALSLSGAGTLRMVGEAELGMSTASTRGPVIANAVGHRIEGAGVIFQNLTNEGTLSANSSEVLLVGGGLLRNRGLVEATGAGGLDVRTLSGVENTGTIRSSGSSISITTMTNDGSIEVTQGGQLSVLFGVTNNGLIEVTQGGNFDSLAPFSLTNGSTGRVLVSGPGSQFTGRLSNGGLFEVMNGGRGEIDSALNGTVRIGEGSVIDVFGRVDVTGVLDLAGGTLQTRGGRMQIRGTSQVSGTGRIDLAGGETSFNLIGKLAPGGVGGIGAFDIVGDVDVYSSFSAGRSQIEIELGGAAQGEYDMISVDGTLSLRGSILVDLINLEDPMDPAGNFDPSTGSIFDIIMASNIVDLGGTVVLPTFDDGRAFTRDVVRVGSMDVLRLVVIPEPSTALLLASGLALLASTKRQRVP